jgi:cell shape-determining protein MreC
MSYLQDRKIKRTRNTILATIATILLIIFILSRPAVSRGLSSLFQRLGITLWKGGEATTSLAEQGGTLFVSKSSLIKERDELKQHVTELEAKNLQASLLEAENEQLKNLMNKAEGKQFKLAAILARPNQSVYGTLIIDKGEKDGVTIGSHVFAESVLPLGTISEVYPASSKVVLYSSNGEKNFVIVSGKNIQAELIGRGGQNFEMTFPRDVEIPIGSSVALPGFPTQPFATVEKVMFDPRDPFQNVLLRSLVNVQELQIVQIEK